MEPIKLLGNLLLVKADDPKEDLRTTSGLTLVQNEDPNPNRGEVVDCGPGELHAVTAELVPMTVKVGDRIRFRTHSVDEIKLDGVDYLVMKEDNVLFVY